MKVTFLNRMKKSYKVEVSDDVKFLNERGCHVETPEENLESKTFDIDLKSRRVKNMRGSTAVMYDIVGVTNGKYPAHITTYFGPESGAKLY
jgi:hypothetical protein